MTAAFFYLSARSIVNRIRRRLVRLREPRYAIGLVIGLGYLYMMVFRQSFQGGGKNISSLNAVPGAVANVQLAVTMVLFTMAAISWAWPGTSRAVTFTRAEVQFFFTAPVTRRQLLHYKLLRTQLATLLSSAILTLVFRRGIAGGSWMFLTGVWLAFATINLYLTGVSLRRASLLQHGASALRRQWLPVGLVVGAIGVLAWAIYADWPALAALRKPGEIAAELNRVASQGLVQWMLWPFRAITRVPFAASLREYWLALPATLGILAVNYIWVIRSDAAFEEASAERAEKIAEMRAAMRQGRSATLKATPTPFKLAATGPLETAIMWKNLILFGRYVSIKTLMRLLPLVVVFGVMVTSSRSTGFVAAAGILCLMLLIMTVILGPQIARNDLRQDLARLAVLKTWPIRGATLLRGEILAPLALLTGVAMVLIVFGFFLAPSLPKGLVSGTTFVLNRVSYATAALLIAPAFILVQLVVQNGIAVMFPAWISIGSDRSRGIDAMGQRLLMMAGILLTLVVALIPAAIIAAIVGGAVYLAMGVLPVVLPAVAATIALVVESWLAIEALGLVLDRTDVSAIDPVE